MNPNKDRPSTALQDTIHESHNLDTIIEHKHTPAHSHELGHQYTPEKTAEHYKAETEKAHDLAATEKQHRERASPTHPTAERRGPVKVDEEFTHTMVSIRQEMTPAQQTFSRFIHAKPIEVTSDFLAATINRPNAMLAGSVSAFLLMLALYLFTKAIGYTLSGFELIATFAIGWILGMLYDYVRSMLNNK